MGVALAVLVGLACGCAADSPPSPRSAHAGTPIITPADVDLAMIQVAGDEGDEHQNAAVYAAMSAVLGRTDEELAAYVDPNVSPMLMKVDPEAAFGRVFRVEGALRNFVPRRDGRALPGDLDESWSAFLFDTREGMQPYYLHYAGSPREGESAYEAKICEVVGVFTHLMPYEDRAGREHDARVLVIDRIGRGASR